MSTKNYTELCKELEQLQDELDGENNQEMRTEIEKHITDVRGLIANYDLGDDDLFQCQRCDGIFDIEDSVQPDGDELYCEQCANVIANAE